MGDGGGRHWLVWMGWHPAGWSVCLPLLIFPCTIKSRSSLLAPAHQGGPGKRAVKRLWWVVMLQKGTFGDVAQVFYRLDILPVTNQQCQSTEESLVQAEVNHSAWPGSSSSTRIMKERALLHLHQLSDTSTISFKFIHGHTNPMWLTMFSVNG